MPTKIEWTEETWNPVTGCTKLSAGCRNCYAERMAKRLAGRCGYPRDDPFRVTVHLEKLREPFRWAKPRLVFVCSMGDLFHDNVPSDFIADVFGIMAVTGAREYPDAKGGCFQNGVEVSRYEPPSERYPNGATHIGYRFPGGPHGPHTFQILTKRPQRAANLLTRLSFRTSVMRAAYKWAMNKRDAGYLADCIDYRGKWSAPGRENRLWPLPNVWIGATVEHRDQLGRIGALRGVPAAGRFLSCEPLLCDLGLTSKVLEGIDWVIAGGESGPGARPMHPDWVRAARDACQAAGVPFFFKSWGRWVPAISDGQPHWFRFDPSCSNLDGCGDAEPWGDGTASIRINSKKLAGRLLDGRTWDEVPWEVHDAR